MKVIEQTELRPVNSSGAMWIGVPTMLPDIMASGLQKPRSVIFALSCLSNLKRNKKNMRSALGSIWVNIKTSDTLKYH